jgi:hypothetical protein
MTTGLCKPSWLLTIAPRLQHASKDAPLQHHDDDALLEEHRAEDGDRVEVYDHQKQLCAGQAQQQERRAAYSRNVGAAGDTSTMLVYPALPLHLCRCITSSILMPLWRLKERRLPCAERKPSATPILPK